MVVGNRKCGQIVIAKIAKVLNAIDLGSKYSWAINNIDICVARDLKFTKIQKYQRYTYQIFDKVNQLSKDLSFILIVFINCFWKTHKYEKVTENMMIRHEINLIWV